VCELAASYEQVKRAAETLAGGVDWPAISGANARRIYNLPPPSGPAAVPSGASDSTPVTPS